MTSQNNLEIKGSLTSHSLAELLAELAETNLHGSLRVSSGGDKAVVYINAGKPVFAASNHRRFKLFEMVLNKNLLDEATLKGIENFTNDLELGRALQERQIVSGREADELFTEQVAEIIKFAFSWKSGEWVFSPLARLRQDIEFPVNIQNLLLEYGRNLPKESIVRRFKSFNESFGVKPGATASFDLLPQEAFLLSRFEDAFLKIEDIRNLSGLPDMTTLQMLYTLWLGGFLYRQNWNPAFSQKKISDINGARLTLKREEEIPAPIAEQKQAEAETITEPTQKAVPTPPPVSTPEPDTEKLLADYLLRAENAMSHYEFLQVSVDAGLSDIKRAYFSLAKQFHPDKFHQEKDSAKLLKIQNAFTQAAQAYETLKDEQARKTYDYKLGKQLELEKSAPVSKATAGDSKETQKEMARQSFEEGFTLLMQEDYDEAMPYLARAVQYAPDNARYHAYFGKLLSTDESQRYKADMELQTAIRLDPNNATYRLMAAEFYIEYNLKRRAEGELQRLLAMQPNNFEARQMLDSLR